jgi:hypothetical protein
VPNPIPASETLSDQAKVAWLQLPYIPTPAEDAQKLAAVREFTLTLEQLDHERSKEPYSVDANGDYMDGSQNYKLHLPPNIQVKTFWSLIPYDSQTRSVLQTDQRDMALSNETGTVQTNPDGLVDVFFGPQAPPGRESNWIQLVPGKGWFTILRLYSPLEPWLDKTWHPGEITRID